MNIDEVRPRPLGEVEGSPENIRLRDFRPRSVFRTPHTQVLQAAYPVIDMHVHAWQDDTDIRQLVEKMDLLNVEKAIVLSFESGDGFDQIVRRFDHHPRRFDIWCGLDYTGYDQPGSGWTDRAIANLERCRRKGARGVGELGDKGLGEYYSRPVAGYGMHLNDSRMQPLLQKCGDLGLPVNVHIADPIWMYLPMDEYNDGMMNAYKWRIDTAREGLPDHAQLLDTFRQAVANHPGTVFIAAHLANCSHNLALLGHMLDQHPNLYADITSRLKEICTVPRYAAAFLTKYQDRLVFGSDAGYDPSTTLDFAEGVYQASFRLLESADEHIYEHDLFKYHWPLYGLQLPHQVLKKLYRDNALQLISA